MRHRAQDTTAAGAWTAALAVLTFFTQAWLLLAEYLAFTCNVCLHQEQSRHACLQITSPALQTFEEREALNAAIVRSINEASEAWGLECMR